MNELAGHALLQVGAVEDHDGDANETAPTQEDDDADMGALEQEVDGLERSQDEQEKREKAEKAEKEEQRQNTYVPGSGTVPIANITKDVAESVSDVEKVMDGIHKEMNKNEVLGNEVTERAQVLITLLQTEVRECSADAHLVLSAPAARAGASVVAPAAPAVKAAVAPAAALEVG